jgi:hypothetical protein
MYKSSYRTPQKDKRSLELNGEIPAKSPGNRINSYREADKMIVKLREILVRGNPG